MYQYILNALLLAATLLLGHQHTYAQVTVNADPTIQAMFDQYTQKLKATQTVAGWRVQIAASTDREYITQLKGDLLRLYPDINPQWTYTAPYYKLNVGAYPTQRDAEKMRLKLEPNFPSAYLVRDEIKIRELLPN
jgi:hypothetical protein